jgi:hypothetical protein
MSEMWRGNHEKETQNSRLLENLEVLFEAAALNYMNDDKKMVEWLIGEELVETGDKVSRVAFANWASKKKFLIEKPLQDADDNYKKSLFVDESGSVAYMIYITDILQRDLCVGTFIDESDCVECIQVEIYTDGRIAFIYYGTPANTTDSESTEEESSEETITMNGLELIGAECTEQGPEAHATLEKYIYNELGFGYWLDEFKKTLDLNIDDFVKQCSENDS